MLSDLVSRYFRVRHPSLYHVSYSSSFSYLSDSGCMPDCLRRLFEIRRTQQLVCLDITFRPGYFLIFIESSKTDQYRDGAWLPISSSSFITCPLKALNLCISQFQAPTSPGLTPGEFFKVVKFPAPGHKIFAKSRPRGKKIDKISAPGDNFVDLQDNFAMIVKPFSFFWYSSLAWLS